MRHPGQMVSGPAVGVACGAGGSDFSRRFGSQPLSVCPYRPHQRPAAAIHESSRCIAIGSKTSGPCRAAHHWCLSLKQCCAAHLPPVAAAQDHCRLQDPPAALVIASRSPSWRPDDRGCPYRPASRAPPSCDTFGNNRTSFREIW
jgi:hypothetical protein